MTKKLSFIIFAVFSIIIGLYPILYFITDSTFGILNAKSEILLNNGLWTIAFYMHISLGGLALLIGWTQFNQALRKKNINLHRNLGKVYLISVIFSSFSALYIALHATGGIVSTMGFSCLALIWLYATLRAFLEIKNASIRKHEKFMIYSYAACFAAVSLRIMLPVLFTIFQDVTVAHRIVAWLCWIPNMIVAHVIIKKRGLHISKLFL